MPYDFSKQQDLLNTAVTLLHTKGIGPYAFGGGTALSAFYLKHRYSTDIDIFLYPDGSNDRLKRLRSDWDKTIEDAFSSIGYTGVVCAPGHYLEFTIDKESKIQFFDNNPFTKTPFISGMIWGHQINIESQEEILAKKIFYRGDKGNARDIFDIAVSFRSDPSLICKLNRTQRLTDDKWADLYTTLSHICESQERFNAYLIDIDAMSPVKHFEDLSKHAPFYLRSIVETLIYLHTDINEEDMEEISNVSYAEAPIEYYDLAGSGRKILEDTIEEIEPTSGLKSFI